MVNQGTQVCEDDFEDDSEDDFEDDTESEEDLLDDLDHADLIRYIAEYVDEYAVEMSSPDFWQDILDDFDIDEEVAANLVKEYLQLVPFAPPIRSRPTEDSCLLLPPGLLDDLAKCPQPEQRSPEWFLFRHNVITASSVGKLFASDAQRNSVIYEKCRPLSTPDFVATNFDSPLHWGQKYEPLSLLFYEHLFSTKVGAFGCIQHPTCPCLAASPDGINLGPRRYGRMLEIKNIVNRDITGVPIEAYWIQMQIQMEVCNLDACDFFETRFCEYPDEDAFWVADTPHRGVMLLFISADYLQHKYEIMPIDTVLTKENVAQWIQNTRSRMFLFQTIYWYLDEYSCVLVDRNRQWFAAAKPVIEETWTTIVTERTEGYDHRAPKSKR